MGERVQFTDTDNKLRIYNGHIGTITRLDPVTGEITATLDEAGKEGGEAERQHMRAEERTAGRLPSELERDQERSRQQRELGLGR